MRIHHIKVNNFKSLVEFDLNLPKFTCLIGLNGSGKSTVLQFIDFLSQQVRGDIERWLDDRHWKARDIGSRLTPKKRTVDFEVTLIGKEGEADRRWKASFNTSLLHCTYELIETPRTKLEVEKGRLTITDLIKDEVVHDEKVSFSYQGSVLSQLKTETLPKSLMAFRDYVSSIKSLDLLSPEYLRTRTRESAGSLGLGGQRLASFLSEIGVLRRRKLLHQLKLVYPQLIDLHAKSLRAGWKQIEIIEKYRGGDSGFFPVMTTEARHINDGMLRLMAILAELETGDRFLLFDEIENGINPELVEFVIDKLVNAGQQVLVTTHSPMILNYLEDEIARDGVIYLYKTPHGDTKSIPFFSIPSLAEKLTVMGPGEAFVDTNLTELAEEIAGVPTEEE